MKKSFWIAVFAAGVFLSGCDEGSDRVQEFQSRGEAANRLSLAGDYQRASEAAVKLAEDFPDSAKAQLLAGAYLMKYAKETGKYPNDAEVNKQILSYLDKGMALGGVDMRMEWMAALSYAVFKKPGTAMEIFRKYKSDDSFMTLNGYVESFPGFSSLIADSGDLESALEVMDAALAANPGHDSLAQEKVKLLTEFSTIEAVESFAKDFEREFGFRETIQFHVCVAYKYRKLKEKAASCFEMLLATPGLSDEQREIFLTEAKDIGGK